MFGLFKKKPEPAQPDPSLIVPRIKHKDFLTAIREQIKGSENELQIPVTEPLVGDLLVTYALDLPEMFQMFNGLHAQQLGLSGEQLRSVAVDNLRMQLDQIRREGEPPLLKLVGETHLAACALLVDEIWQAFEQVMPPEIVVGVPTRDVVFITTSASTRGGLQLLRAAVDDAYNRENSPHRLTQGLLVRRQNRWEVFDVSK